MIGRKKGREMDERMHEEHLKTCRYCQNIYRTTKLAELGHMIRGTAKTFNPPILIISIWPPDIIFPKNNAPLCSQEEVH